MDPVVQAETREGFRRQRKRLLVISVILFLYQWAGLKFRTLSILGNEVAVGRPEVITYALWFMFAYYLYRYTVYLNDLGDRGILCQCHRWSHPRIQEVARRLAQQRILGEKPELRDNPTRQFDVDGSVHRSFHREEIRVVLRYRACEPGGRVHGDEVRMEETVSIPFAKLILIRSAAVLYVVFLTHAGSEYLFPYIVSLVPILHFVFVR